MNIPLLRRIQRQIDKAPERFQMGRLFIEHPCGSSFCICGWAATLSGLTPYCDEFYGFESRFTGQKELGLTADQAARLIYMGKWPAQFQGPDDYSEEAAARAIARISHFIATEGRE